MGGDEAQPYAGDTKNMRGAGCIFESIGAGIGTLVGLLLSSDWYYYMGRQCFRNVAPLRYAPAWLSALSQAR